MLDRIFKSHAMNIRIATGLVGMVISVFLVAVIIGIVPDSHHIVAKHRAALTEALAINGSAFITLSDIHRLEADLKLVVARNEDILSAAIKKPGGENVVVVDDHNSHWLASEDAAQTGSQLTVPLYEGGNTWGHLEPCALWPFFKTSRQFKNPLAT